MKWFSDKCARHRQKICLLAGGVLPESERVEVENHLAECAGCRTYHAEIRCTVAPLVNWEKQFAHIEPNQSQQMRWAKAIKASTESKSSLRLSPWTMPRVFWNELFIPARRIWAGLAAAWVLIAIANLKLSGEQYATMTKGAMPSTDMILAWREQERMLAEIVGKTEPNVAEPPKRTAPQPRSQRPNKWFTA